MEGLDTQGHIRITEEMIRIERDKFYIVYDALWAHKIITSSAPQDLIENTRRAVVFFEAISVESITIEHFDAIQKLHQGFVELSQPDYTHNETICGLSRLFEAFLIDVGINSKKEIVNIFGASVHGLLDMK